MIGVTIGIGEPYNRMAKRAAFAFMKHFATPAHVIGEHHMKCLHLSCPHELKFELFNLFPEEDSIVFFDADLVFRQRVSMHWLTSNEGFTAVKDLSKEPWIIDDANKAGVPPDLYFNSGLFWISRDRKDILTRAKRLKRSGAIVTKFKDQTFLNAAAWMGGSVNYISKRFNYHVDPVHTRHLDDIIGAHVHWISRDKENIDRYYRELDSMFWQVPQQSCEVTQ